MTKLKRYGKVILFDTLAGLCFIGVILFGWLPGPGGVPLLILGLSLLAVNHDWAERWLETAKHKGVTFKNWLFPKTPWVRHTYDIVAIILFSAGIFGLIKTSARWVEGIIVIIMCAALAVFLFNRERFDKISSLFKRKH